MRLLPLLLLLSGCAHMYEVTPLQADGHYLVVQINKTGAMKVRDCQSRPNGHDYDPECVVVKMK